VKSNAGGNRVRGPPAGHPEKISLAGFKIAPNLAGKKALRELLDGLAQEENV
jgi:hypothetical protein